MSHRDYASSLFPSKDIEKVDLGPEMRSALIHAIDTLENLTDAQRQALDAVAALRLSDPCDRLQHELEDIRDPVTAAHLQGQKHGLDGFKKDISVDGLKAIKSWLQIDRTEEQE